MNALLRDVSVTSRPGTLSSETLRGQRSRLLSFIRKRVRSREDAEDLVQDVFYQLAVSENVGRPIEELTSWLFTVARNKIIDWYRRRTHDLRTDFFDYDGTPMDLDEVIFDPSASPEQNLDRALFWAEFEDALEALPPAQREAFIKHELEDLSFRDIADETGASVSALLSRKHSAVKNLRERLRELYENWDT